MNPPQSRRGREGNAENGWSSLAGYLAPPRKRSGWVQVTRGLEQKEIQSRDHGEAAALRLVALGLQLAGLENENLESLRKNDWRKRVIGRAVRRNTTVPAAWISEQLRMGNVVRCAALTAKDPDDSWGPKWTQARSILTKMEKEYRNID